MENAIDHAPPGSAVTVRARGATNDAPVEGTGLGLAIASWIAERYGGRLVAGHCLQGGARFTLSLPAA